MKEKSINNSEKTNAYGQVFKNFRVSKGFTQREASNNIISPTHLSNFENGKTMISINHFFDLLENINVNMFEYQNSFNQYIKGRDIMLFNTDMSDALISQDFSKLHQILNELDKEIVIQDANNDIKLKLKLDYIRVKSILSHIDSDYQLNTEEVTFLEEYLFELSEWGQYDIALLGQCAKFIDLIHLIQLTKEMLSPFQSSANISYNKQAIIQTVLNIIDIYESRGACNFAKRLIKYLNSIEIHDYYMFEKLTLVYLEAKCDYNSGDEKGLEIMKKCQSIFEFCNCTKTANWIDLEIKKK